MKLIAAIFASLALSVAAAGADEIVDATSPDRLLPYFAKFGAAEMGTDDVGDPMIRGNIDGIIYVVFFYDCTDGADCKNLTMTASWDTDAVRPESINEWNRKRRFGKAYFDSKNDPAIQMAINLDGGVTAANFEDTVDWWRVVMGEFRDEVIGS